MFDFSSWHKACQNKQVIDGGIYGLIAVCYNCGVAAQVEAIASKISPQDACAVGAVYREIIGQNTANIIKGEVQK